MALLILAASLLQLMFLAPVIHLWVMAGAALAARLRPKKADAPFGSEKSFAVLIPAHNEEKVIGQLLKSLQRQHYPLDKYQAFVVADNCSDDTATLARRHGAACYERRSEGPSTKAQALSWLWQQVSPQAQAFDAVVILDADNLVSHHFLAELSAHLGKGFSGACGPRLAKNLAESWASRLDGASQMAWYTLIQPGRHALGLSPAILGSGVAFARPTFDWLIRQETDSLVEDAEWQVLLALQGSRLAWVPGATVYDEKIRSLSQLPAQRGRWVRGRLLLAKKYGGALLRTMLRGRVMASLDLFLSTINLPRSWLMAAYGLLLVGGLWGLPGLWGWWIWLAALLSIPAHVLLGLILGRAPLSIYMSLAYSPVFVLRMLGVALGILAHPAPKEWAATEHSSTFIHAKEL